MGDMHIKGRLLQLLAERGPMWDYELAEEIEREYAEVGGDYWRGAIRLMLADAYSSGLIRSEEEKLDPSRTSGEEKVLFRFALSEFGRERMGHTGLLSAGSAAAAPSTVGAQ